MDLTIAEVLSPQDMASEMPGKSIDVQDYEERGAPLETLVQWFEGSEEATWSARSLSERDRDYYDNKQLTATERAELARRGQPEVIINRIKRKVEFLKGMETEQRTDPKAFPRNPDDEDSAEAATDALRFVADNTQLDLKRSRVWENMLIEGTGGLEVIVEMKRSRLMETTAMTPPEAEIVVNHIPWDRLFWDPHSAMQDFSDARYRGIVIWMDYDEAKERHPEAEDIFDTTLQSSSHGETYDDRPKYSMWADGKRKRVRLVQMYYRWEGVWHWCLFTKGGKIDGGKSPYIDKDGEPECPLEMVSTYVDRENNRYGVVREMVSPQDEYNKRRSKALHLLTMRQVRVSNSAQDVRTIRQELAKPDGVIVVDDKDDFEILPTGDMASGQVMLMQQSAADLDLMGPNASMQGKGEQDQSGRAIIAQQQGGTIENAPNRDLLRQMNRRCYEQMWNRIRQFWTEERWIRVTDDEKNVRFVGLNRQVTAGEIMQGKTEQALAAFAQQSPPPEAMQAAQQQAEQAIMVSQQDPRWNTPVAVENNVGEMAVDITVDDTPDTVTIQHEQFQEIAKLAPVMQTEGIPVARLIITASQLRNKSELLEMLDKREEAGAAQQQAAAELAMQKEQSEIAKNIASAKEDEADALKTAAEAAREEMEAVRAGQEANALQALGQDMQQASNIRLPALQPGP